MNGNGERPTVNGDRLLNGLQRTASDTAHSSPSIKNEKSPHPVAAVSPGRQQSRPNGDLPRKPENVSVSASEKLSDHLLDAPQDILQLVPRDSYLPVATLINRATQSCWNGLSSLVQQLATIQVPDRTDPDRPLPNGHINNQSDANLQKKERLMRFCYDQRNDFIKLAVLLDWSKNVDHVAKTISINYWLMRQRQAYWDTIAAAAILRQEAAGFQLPNPDLKTAAEILSTGRSANLPTFGYIPQKPLSNKQILSLLKSLNRKLTVKLALTDNLPPQLKSYRVHDGRVTFTVPDMFELDLSILDDSADSPFRIVDFRLTFSPAPKLSDNLRAEIELCSNSNIDRDGIQGCFLFLHELALSYKLAAYQKQAVELSRTHWAGNLRVEVIRRNLIVQYWTEKPNYKSWIEIGISSGRQPSAMSPVPNLPYLDIKWMRQGKKVRNLALNVTQSTLRFEDILSQVVAQDSTLVIDDIYSSLLSTPLFSNAELSVQQRLSYTDPNECSLTLQLFRSTYLDLRIDPVTGSIVTSPVSEKSERLQFEVNRSQAVASDVSTKLLNFRASIMESVVLAAIVGTRWEVMRAFKFTQVEIKSLFGGPIVKLDMLRQVQWGPDYFLAITHAHNGDFWRLLRQSSHSETHVSPQFSVILSQRIDVNQEITPAYFERLADYTTGFISLRRSADYLAKLTDKYKLPRIPDFGDVFELPQISFPLDWARPRTATSSSRDASGVSRDRPGTAANVINIRFEGIDPSSKEAIFIAKMDTSASTNTLRQLVDPSLDENVLLNPEERSITIRATSAVSDTAIPTIVATAIRLETLISTIQQIRHLPGVKLESLSSSGVSVSYYKASDTQELSVRISLGSNGHPPRLEFSPPGDNPHALLASPYSKILAMGDGPTSTKIRDLFTSLMMSYPVLSFLHKLQKRHGAVGETPSSEKDDTLRVHILARTVHQFAVQYFATLPQTAKDIGSDQQPSLIARLEILPHTDKTRKPMWMVRPALEEFQAYARPSFSATALRNKLRQEVLTLTDPPKQWLALDNAAACLTDQPEPLLSAVHDVLSTFVKEANSTPVRRESTSQSSAKQGPGGNASAGTKAKSQNPANVTTASQGQGRPGGKLQVPGAGSNGAMKPVQQQPLQNQRPNMSQGRPMPNKSTGKANAPNNQDNPITLD
ncbi:hypothetical protein B0A52_05705 [Exophiala mesophila]|uniref:Mediator of RNA polymerase II transcription subunit 14 n=1 Tax=Exophiala mesophila TaxID=212818 RepID=A0A438N2B2_EXOME|nr:hypothetical protein B0A52_05705 [Exophiala mesophila]